MIFEKHDSIDNIRKFIIEKYNEELIKYEFKFKGIMIYSAPTLPSGELLLFDGDVLIAKIIGVATPDPS